MVKKAAKLVVSGTVQGVFFRQFIKDNADKLNLKGITRNLDDGNVEIIVEGDHRDIDKMVEVCKQGPKHAQIKNVAVEERKYSGDFTDFKMLRM